MLITHKQMWNRYRSIKKNKPSLKITCPVCNQEILEDEDDVEYSKTKSGSEIFIHKECVKKWSE